MALARFFDRVYAAAGRQLSVERASLEAHLGDQRIAVRCGAACEVGTNEHWIAEMLVSLLARMYPRLAFQSGGAIDADLSSIARAINPAIEIDSSDSPTLTIVIGEIESSPANTLFPSANGWVARLSQRAGARSSGPANPYAAGVAACITAAEVFRKVFHEHVPPLAVRDEVSVSLLDFHESTGGDLPLPATALGEVGFAGLGAVANGALWALGRHDGVTGQLSLIDPEAVDISNLQRYVLTKDSDVGRMKTEMCEDALRGSDLRVSGHKQSLEAFAGAIGAPFALPTIAVSVDNAEGRRTAQALLPRLAVNGWTSDGGLGASWHEFGQDAACLSCLYHPTGVGKSQSQLVSEALGLPEVRTRELLVRGEPALERELDQIAQHLELAPEVIVGWRGKHLSELYTNVICGSVGLDLKGVGRLEAVPLAHQSALAGLLMAVELVKRLDPTLRPLSQRAGYLVWDDVRRPPPRSWAQARSRVPGCICGDEIYRGVYQKKWPDS